MLSILVLTIFEYNSFEQDALWKRVSKENRTKKINKKAFMSIPCEGFFASCGLKKFQLLGYFYRVSQLFALENFHHAELLVCNRHDTDMPFLR